MPTCRLSCRLEVLPGSGVLEQLRNAHRYGFDAVSLPGRYLSTWLDGLRACIADSPVSLAALSLGFTGSLVSPMAEQRCSCRDSLLRLFDVCADLGIGLFNMPPFLIQDNPTRITAPGTYPSPEAASDALLLEQLPGLCDEARSRGVVLLLEPVNRYESDYLNTLPHAARICAAVGHPSLGVTCDFYHMQLEELNTAESMAAAADRIRHVHVAENTRVEPGIGSMDFESGFRVLRRKGYRGYIEVECRSLSGPADEVLPESVRFLRETYDRAV